MKHQVAELDGALLDAAVALAEGWSAEETRDDGVLWYDHKESYRKELLPWSVMWEYGGPIIDRERIGLLFLSPKQGWCAQVDGHRGERPPSALGLTPLIAAMRAYVASKFGEEVELP
jgi:hypothetical protein